MEDFLFADVIRHLDAVIAALESISVRGAEDCRRMASAIADTVTVNNYIKAKQEGAKQHEHDADNSQKRADADD